MVVVLVVELLLVELVVVLLVLDELVLLVLDVVLVVVGAATQGTIMHQTLPVPSQLFKERNGPVVAICVDQVFAFVVSITQGCTEDWSLARTSTLQIVP